MPRLTKIFNLIKESDIQKSLKNKVFDLLKLTFWLRIKT